MADVNDSKVCRCCGLLKSHSDYTKVSKVKDGLSSQCRQCQKEQYHQNKDRFKDRKAEYYRRVGSQKQKEAMAKKLAVNPNLHKERYAIRFEYIKAHAAAWRKANPDIARMRDKQRHEKYKASRSAYSKEWKRKNRDIVQAQNWLRRLHQTPEQKEIERGYLRKHGPKTRAKRNHANVVPGWANSAEIEAVYKARDRLNRKFGVELHVDHVVPLNSPIVCGLHTPANLQLLDSNENLKKGNRVWPDMPNER